MNEVTAYYFPGMGIIRPENLEPLKRERDRLFADLPFKVGDMVSVKIAGYITEGTDLSAVAKDKKGKDVFISVHKASGLAKMGEVVSVIIDNIAIVSASEPVYEGGKFKDWHDTFALDISGILIPDAGKSQDVSERHKKLIEEIRKREDAIVEIRLHVGEIIEVEIKEHTWGMSIPSGKPYQRTSTKMYDRYGHGFDIEIYDHRNSKMDGIDKVNSYLDKDMQSGNLVKVQISHLIPFITAELVEVVKYAK